MIDDITRHRRSVATSTTMGSDVVAAAKAAAAHRIPVGAGSDLSPSHLSTSAATAGDGEQLTATNRADISMSPSSNMDNEMCISM